MNIDIQSAPASLETLAEERKACREALEKVQRSERHFHRAGYAVIIIVFLMIGLILLKFGETPGINVGFIIAYSAAFIALMLDKEPVLDRVAVLLSIAIASFLSIIVESRFEIVGVFPPKLEIAFVLRTLGLLVIVMIFSILALSGATKYSEPLATRKREQAERLKALAELNPEGFPDACIELAQWQAQDTTIQTYLNQIKGTGRTLIYGEYLAAKTWMAGADAREKHHEAEQAYHSFAKVV